MGHRNGQTNHKCTRIRSRLCSWFMSFGIDAKIRAYPITIGRGSQEIKPVRACRFRPNKNRQENSRRIRKVKWFDVLLAVNCAKPVHLNVPLRSDHIQSHRILFGGPGIGSRMGSGPECYRRLKLPRAWIKVDRYYCGAYHRRYSVVFALKWYQGYKRSDEFASFRQRVRPILRGIAKKEKIGRRGRHSLKVLQ